MRQSTRLVVRYCVASVTPLSSRYSSLLVHDGRGPEKPADAETALRWIGPSLAAKSPRCSVSP